MNTTILRTSAVALATGLLCWHQAGHAAATESQLRGIVLYGNVSIQEDSTGSWGPWAEFEPTAAGNTAPVAAPRAANDPYRPLAQTAGGTPPVWAEGTPCLSGSLCGFGAFTEARIWDPNESVAREQESAPVLHPYFHVGEVLAGPNAEGGHPYLPATVVLTTSLLSDTGEFLLPDSGPLNLNDSEGAFYRGGDKRNYTLLWPQDWTSFFDPEEVQATLIMNGQLQTYVNGTIRQQSQWGVIGYATPGEQMASLLNSGASATYRGYDSDNGDVRLQVNFGAGTWSGTWNDGIDNSVYAGATASGSTVLQGQVGFTASGRVNGVNFRSDQVGTNDAGATVSGFVQGVFYGPVNVNAPANTRGPAAAGGVADITKTTQSYTNGRFVSPFLAVRSDLFKANQAK